jgi:sarcosine oxidase subunit alpha
MMTPNHAGAEDAQHYDVAIVGAGPAGLTAAADLASAGQRVIVIDENPRTGGKLRGQLHEEGGGHWWNGPELADALEDAAREAGAELLLNAVVWQVHPGWTVHVTFPAERDAAMSSIRADRVIVASGAVERPLPLDGWTLPGVMTIGAAQVLTNIHRVQPGARVLVVGMDALSLTIARAMQLGGVDVVGIVLPPSKTGMSPLANLARLAPMAKLAPAWYMRAGAPFLKIPPLRWIVAHLLPKRFPVWGIPLMLRTAVERVTGSQQVDGVELVDVGVRGGARASSRRQIEVDAVAIANGLAPLNELVAPLARTFVRAKHLGGVVPVYDEFLRTEVEGLYIAGNAAGIEGAKMAIEQGRLVAQTVLRDTGSELITDGDLRERVEQIRRKRRSMEFQFDPLVERGLSRVARAWAERTPVEQP